MRLIAFVSNVLLLGIGAIILSGDGPPEGAEDIVFVTWSVATHLLSIVVIWRAAARHAWLDLHVNRSAFTATGKPIVTAVANVVLFGLVCAHLALQYDHPDEPGVLVVAALMILTPLLTLMALFARCTTAPAQRTAAVAEPGRN